MKETYSTEEAIKRWDANAEAYTKGYTEEGDLHREVFLNPCLFTLIGDSTDKKILDAGCGEGYLSRKLAHDGASVTAVDYSEKMLEIAKEKTSSSVDVTSFHGNCETLPFLEDSSFDLIVSNMVMQDLSDHESALREMYRLLIDGGSFIFSILHPCFVTPESGWEKNDQGEKLHWNVDRYFYEGVYEQRGIGENDKILYYHRTLSTYMNSILQTGFMVEKVEEPTPSKEILEKYPAFEEDFRCADFIVFKVVKK
ncbi:class I SAM-dependent methyltransferase [Guptibacillus algicola]|uniref:class I SAM-dependent methyltransferase n=1 Tax=Guptibacillus algicola TaxID=225844 RepID=UPI001CD47FEF|nr:class I SAM-dependent methyltransferase [Alkalihalobacillus algicola]MCA0986518.1 class I SAM-dependent methyltransferase [Alkalihalobacillus algicola]